MQKEKRNYIRYAPSEDTFAVLRNRFEKIGKVLDISINGLSFLYMPVKKKDKPPLQVDIFLTDNGFHLYRIPCRIIYDIPYDGAAIESALSHRRCGLIFDKIAEEHSEKLKKFLRKKAEALPAKL